MSGNDRTRRPRCGHILLGATLAAHAPAQGMDFQPHASIREAAAHYIEHQLEGSAGRPEVSIGGLDVRLRLPRCGEALEAYLPPGGRLSGNTSVGVRCNGARPWKVYVAVTIEILQPVLVARRYLARGTIVTKADIEFAERDVTRERRGYFSAAEPMLGQALRQPLARGAVITPASLTRPLMVRRGEPVTLVVGNGAFEVRMRGEALMDGAAGDHIRVKNTNSQRIIGGRVLASGVVDVRS